MPDRIPVLFDTDIGTDIDDALCLTYLLAQPRCELLGITTATGEPQKRAMLADAVCRAAGREGVPIHSGSPEGLLIPMRQTRCQQAEVLPRWPHRSDFPPAEAVEFLRETIRSRPGEIVLLAVGPMTNIALLFTVDPEVVGLLRGLVLMCGVFREGGPGAREWNAMGDPHATAAVYRGRVRPHTSIGLDVTRRCVMPADECRKRLHGGALDVVRDAAEVWFSHGHPHITFHDPLAAAVIFEPDLCRFAEGRVEVELHSARSLGATVWNPTDEEKPHRMAVGVDAERFFEHYFAVVSGGSQS